MGPDFPTGAFVEGLAGIIDQVVGALTKWTPELYFDGVLSNKFGSKRLRSLNTLDDHDIK